MQLRREVAYSALLVSIATGCTPEQAFQKLCPEKGVAPGCLTTEDLADMRKLKLEGESYETLGEIYGLTKHGVYKRIGSMAKVVADLAAMGN